MTITLITCTYNAEAVIQRTLDSVLSQKYADIEHVIVDGKSTDATLAIAQQYKTTSHMQRTGHKISIFSSPDKGLYDAMNKGIAYAHGEYLCFLNAGDVLQDKDTIADIASKASSGGPYSVVYGETDVVDDKGTFLYHRKLYAPERLTWHARMSSGVLCQYPSRQRDTLQPQIPHLCRR